jgi:bacteriorhodopsin
MDLTLSKGQFDLVYNSFSFVIAAMGAAFLFFLLSRSRIAPRHRTAVTLSTLVVAIALYHYVRIFNSFSGAFTFIDGRYVQQGAPFNEGYRYIDWLLTVPLLLAELIVVLKLAKSTTKSLLVRLTIAAVAMILLGWPGELSPAHSTARALWGISSMIPFLYILYVLFVELGRSLDRQGPSVHRMVDALRYIVLGTWVIYPLAYLAPMVIDNRATAEVVRQVGYSVGDVIAKPVFGLIIFAIALSKSRDDGYAPAMDDAPDQVSAGASEVAGG